MSDRLQFIHDANRPDVALIAQALRKIGAILDRADDSESVTVHPLLNDTNTALDWAHAWMGAAIYIADTCDILTPVLNEVSYALDRQNPQPTLFDSDNDNRNREG